MEETSKLKEAIAKEQLQLAPSGVSVTAIEINTLLRPNRDR